MGLETGNYIGDLNSANPSGTDPKGQGDDHFRLIKKVAKASFAGFTKAILVTGTDTGSANTYVLTPTPALPSYDDGMLVVFIPTTGNTGASTLNISSLGAVGLKSVSGADLISGEIAIGQAVVARYNGTEFRLTSITKQYADQLVFSSTLPDMTGHPGSFLYTDATLASWQDVLPTRAAGTADRVLRSSGVLGPAQSTTFWDWDGFQGRQVKSANYTLTIDDRYTWTYFTATATASFDPSATLGSKFYVRIANSSSSGIVTLDPNGSETINGSSTLRIAPNEAWDVISDGSNLFAIRVASAIGSPGLVIQEQQASSAGSVGTAVPRGFNTVIFNTVVKNDVGASLSSNQITLPAGRWYIEASAPAYGFTSSQLRLLNLSVGGTTLIGKANSGGVTDSLRGEIAITTSTVFGVDHFLAGGSGGAGVGYPVNSGEINVFGEFLATRIGG